MSLPEIKKLWEKINNINQSPNTSNLKRDYSLSKEEFTKISDFFCSKFNETREIFSKFNEKDYFKFIKNSSFLEFNENNSIFQKNTSCSDYIFILFGDIDFFDNDTLVKTISAGKVYGHMVKDNYKYDIKSRSKVEIVLINKKIFDDLITNINKEKSAHKFKFIKKFFPNIRLYSDEIIQNILKFFELIKFDRHSKIFLKDEYNEYIYLIVKGQIAFCVRPKLIFISDKNENNEALSENIMNIYKNDYIIIEKMSRGDVFGINSALKGQKNLYTAVILNENAEIYRISKGNILFYFGGSGGILPLALKALGDLQEQSFHNKIDYLKSLNMNDKEIQILLSSIYFLSFDENEKLSKNKKSKQGDNYFLIDENPIINNLFEAWKTMEDLGNKLSEIKLKLLGNNPNIQKSKTEEIKFSTSSNEIKDFTKVSGDATNRIVGRKINFGMNKIKSLDKLNMICGIKKTEEENLKKVENINSKLDGGTKNKLMSFMKNDDNLTDISNNNSMENKTCKNDENEKNNETTNSKENATKEKKPKRVKNRLKSLQGLE